MTDPGQLFLQTIKEEQILVFPFLSNLLKCSKGDVELKEWMCVQVKHHNDVANARAAMIIALIAYVALPRWRRKPIY